jgi:hypothetical protein
MAMKTTTKKTRKTTKKMTTKMTPDYDDSHPSSLCRQQRLPLLAVVTKMLGITSLPATR